MIVGGHQSFANDLMGYQITMGIAVISFTMTKRHDVSIIKTTARIRIIKTAARIRIIKTAVRIPIIKTAVRIRIFVYISTLTWNALSAPL